MKDAATTDSVETDAVETDAVEANAPSAAPGTEGASAAAGSTKPKKESFVEVRDKLIESADCLKDYNGDKYRPLKKADFKTVDLFFGFKADEFQAKADDFRKQAESAKKLGALGDASKAKRLMALSRQIDAIKADLGPDAEALIAELMAGDDDA